MPTEKKSSEQPNQQHNDKSHKAKPRPQNERPRPNEQRQESRAPQQRPQNERPRSEERSQEQRSPQQTSAPRPQRQENRSESRPTSVTVLIPLLNEEESLRELTERLETVLEPITKGAYQLLFVDDGSTDSSFDVLKSLNRKNHRVRIIRFRRNYGKSAALSVGFKRAKGDIIITMDADLQDDPAEIPALLAKLDEGYDLVSGWKRKRYDPWHKTFPSKFFNAVTSRAAGIKLHDFNCGLKAYRREAAKSLNVYGEMHRYLPMLAFWNGFRVTEISVQHHARKHGVSKFGASRFFKGFLDLITVLFTTRYIKRPLHLFGTVGTLLGLIGFGIESYLTVEWMLGLTNLSNRPIALLGILLIIVGVQLVSIGLIGEMIVKNSLKDEQYLIRDDV